MKKMKNAGFSLVELIVVIAIMAILVGVAVPVYTGYIEKTQKAKDEQLVDEIKHAMEIAAIGDEWHNKMPSGGVVGTIVISDTGTTVNAGDNSNTLIADAMTETFGDYSSMKLSYDGWTGTLATDNAIILNTSAYLQDPNGVSDLLGTVQDVTDMFASVYDQYKEKLPSLSEDVFTELGVDKDDATQVANAMIAVIADTSNAIDADSFVTAWGNAATNNCDFSSVFNDDIFAATAAEYAYVQALISRYGCETLKNEFKQFNTGDFESADPYNDIIVAHARNVTCTESTNCLNAITNYTPEQQNADAKAYLQVLKQVSESKDVLKSNITSNSLYTDSPLSQYVSSYISVSDLVAKAGAEDGDVVMVVVMDAKGNVTINVYPFEY